MKILIVEDIEDSRNLLMKQLCAYGHEVTATANGVEALEQSLAQPPDIIISDIMMPKMDGFQLCRECKQSKQLKDIPFVFYTATYTLDEDKKFALSLGVDAFILKPSEPDTLVQTLNEIIEKSKSGVLAPPEVAPLEPSLFLTEYSKRIVAKLENKVAQLEAEITERKRLEYALNERVKELRCLYGISLLERQVIPLEEMCQKTVDLLPPAWQYPEATCARLTIDDQEFSTKNFRETAWKQTNDILVHGQKVGSVEVFYLEERPKSNNGPFLKEETFLLGTIARQLSETIERRQSEEELLKAHNKLETKVEERTAELAHSNAELAAVNKELEAFSYSVSHDLRAPLRSIGGFSQVLLDDYADKLDEQGKDNLQRVCSATQRMSQLIDDILNLSRIGRREMKHEKVNLSALAEIIAVELKKSQPKRPVEFIIAKDLTASGDTGLLQVLLENLLGNAWKFTRKHPRARIEFGVTQVDGKPAFFVHDDGVGFDMAYADKLFGAFQRLHSQDEFPGTGIGLATVQRIVHRHGGQVWAEGKPEEGATFYFKLD